MNSHFKNDYCFINQYNKSNKSIIDYTINNNAFINKSECVDYTPTFINYMPQGVSNINIDIENELRGSTRLNTKCTSGKFYPEDGKIYTNGGTFDFFKQKPTKPVKKECKPELRILPNGYYAYV